MEIELTALGLDGEAIGCRHDGGTVVVAGALPGERARVAVVHENVRARRSHARLLELVRPSPVRRAPPCKRQSDCDGCALMIAGDEAQHELKRALLRERFGIDVDAVVAGEALGYRWSSKRVCGGRRGALRLGSYRRGSHVLADMDGCLVDHPDIAAAVEELRNKGSALGIEPYDERRRRGDLRYVWLKTDGHGQVLLTLVTASAPSRAAEELPAALQRPAGVAWCVQPSEGNAMRGADVRILRGSAELTLELAGVRTAVGPLGFLQPNPRVAELAYRALVAQHDGATPGGALAFDLYAGPGVTSAMLRARFAEVLACDAHSDSSAVTAETAEALLERAIAGGLHPELVVANPPRAGLGPEVCARLNAIGAARVNLMSCGPAALARDRERLCGEGGAYHWLGARGYDTLPQTAHIEVVAWLERR